jgi:hypothetical protein
MERQEQDVALGAGDEEPAAPERAGFEIERPLFLFELAGGDAGVEVGGRDFG